jgi:monoterpene epsilon-lactone hydrolase
VTGAMSTTRWDWHLPPARTGVSAPADLVQRRTDLERRRAAEPAIQEVAISPAQIGGISCLECRPAETEATLLWFHGGGFRLGSAAAWRPFGAALAMAVHATVILADYRLSPENAFPSALHDAASVYTAIASAVESDTTGLPVFVGGDSAGGGVTAGLIVAALRSQLPLPVGVVLASPWLDLTLTSSTFETQAATDQLFTRAAAAEAAAMYLQGADAHDELSSALFADLAGFPATLLFAGGSEILLGDSLQFARALALAGSSVRLVVEAGLPHVWATGTEPAPAVNSAHQAIRDFIKRCR